MPSYLAGLSACCIQGSEQQQGILKMADSWEEIQLVYAAPSVSSLQELSVDFSY